VKWKYLSAPEGAAAAGFEERLLPFKSPLDKSYSTHDNRSCSARILHLISPMNNLYDARYLGSKTSVYPPPHLPPLHMRKAGYLSLPAG